MAVLKSFKSGEKKHGCLKALNKMNLNILHCKAVLLTYF